MSLNRLVSYLFVSLTFTCILVSSLEPLTSAPAQQSLKKGRLDALWFRESVKRMFEERAKWKRTPLIAFSYDGNPAVDIIFKNEAVFPTGSHYHRSFWSLIMWSLWQGHLTRDTHVYDGSLGGNSGLALAYYMRVLSIRNFTIYLPLDVAFEKIAKIAQMGARVERVDPSFLLSRPRDDAAKDSLGFHLNSIANAAYSEMFYRDPLGKRHTSINIFDETMRQLKEQENITKVEYFVAPLGSGQLVSSIGNAVRRTTTNTEVVAVDSQHSLYFDYAVHGRFANENATSHWHLPGIPEMGMALLGPIKYGVTTSFRRDVIDQIIKLPDLAIVATMKVLDERRLRAGPSTAAGFLTALILAATNTKPVEFLTIVIVKSDSSAPYRDTYLNRQWVGSRFAKYGSYSAYDCWVNAINESLSTGWDPLTLAQDKNCPSIRH